MKHWLLRNGFLILFFILILKIVLQYLLIHPSYELHRDEFLHLDQGNHPAWGFVSVPPVTSVISVLIKALGNSVFWVKFFPALFGALTILAVWHIVKEIGGGLFAQVLSAVALLFSALLRINLLYQPNTFDILSWTAVYFGLIKYINTKENKWLYLEAVFIAIGFLNKYNIVFLLVGIIPPFLLYHRKVVSNKHLYGSLLLAFILVLPNLIWQYQHHFPVVHHMQELASNQLINVKRMNFLKEQLLYFINSIFLLGLALAGFVLHFPFKQYRVVGWSFLITISLFTYLRAKGYYAIGLYPVLIAFGSVYLETLTNKGWKRYVQPFSLVFIVVLFIPIIKLAFPVYSPSYIQQHAALYKPYGLLRWEDGKDHALPQDFADMQGWKELTAKVQAVYDTIADKERTIIICDNYGQAGAINYYSYGRLPAATSFNADYLHWMKLDTPITNLIVVKDRIDEDFINAANHTVYKKAGTITNPYAREYGTAIFWMQGNAFVNELLQRLLRERRKE